MSDTDNPTMVKSVDRQQTCSKEIDFINSTLCNAHYFLFIAIYVRTILGVARVPNQTAIIAVIYEMDSNCKNIFTAVQNCMGR